MVTLTVGSITYIAKVNDNVQTSPKAKRFVAYVDYKGSMQFKTYGETHVKAINECKKQVKEWMWFWVNK